VTTAHILQAAKGPGPLAALLLLCIYVTTMCHGLMFFDAGELALVGQQLGLGHPPGQPAYTLLLGLFAATTPSNPLMGMTFLSAFCTALCALPVDRLMVRAGVESIWIRFLVLVACGCLYPVWDQATRIELYSLMSLTMLITLSYAGRILDERDHRARFWLILGLGVGLTVSINPIHGLALGLGIGLNALPSLFRLGMGRLSTAIASAFGGSVVGLSPYLYLVWVHGKTDRFVWGDHDSAEGSWAYLKGADYAHTNHNSWALIPSHAGEWLVWIQSTGGGLLCLLGLIGLGTSPWLRHRCGLWLLPLLAGCIFTFSYGTYFPEVPDYSGYLLPSIWLIAIGSAVLLSRLKAPIALPLVAVLVVSPVLSNGHLTPDRSKNDLALSLARVWLESMPNNAILLAESDHLVFPAMYAQEVMGIRPDVVLINVGFASSRWYWKRIYREHLNLQKVSLTAPSRGARLRRFLLANRDRAQRVETIEIAGQVKVRPCVITWGLALGPECRQLKDGQEMFESTINQWWRPQISDDPIARRVLAQIASKRAQALLAQGEPRLALRSLRVGVPPVIQERLPTPDDMASQTRTLNWDADNMLLTTLHHALSVGAMLLQNAGHVEGKVWFEEARKAALDGDL
jgi:hypothetical protein